MFDNFLAALAMLGGLMLMIAPLVQVRVRATIDARLNYRSALEEAYPAQVVMGGLPDSIDQPLQKLKVVK